MRDVRKCRTKLHVLVNPKRATVELADANPITHTLLLSLLRITESSVDESRHAFTSRSLLSSTLILVLYMADERSTVKAYIYIYMCVCIRVSHSHKFHINAHLVFSCASVASRLWSDILFSFRYKMTSFDDCVIFKAISLMVLMIY